jgi:hypothetical protein
MSGVNLLVGWFSVAGGSHIVGKLYQQKRTESNSIRYYSTGLILHPQDLLFLVLRC